MNPRLAALPASLIRELNGRKRPGDIDLGLGEPTLKPDPMPLLEAAEHLARFGCPYTPNAGLSELRMAIAAHYGYPGLTDGANICITHGSQEALYLALKALLDPAGDEVLIPEPCYLAYPKIARLEGLAVRMVAMSAETGFALEAERVLEAIGPRTRMIMLGSPNNPTGAVLAQAEARKLAEGLLALSEPPWVLTDEVYRELHYGLEPYFSFAQVYPRTLVVNSLSKSSALTGLRLGFLMGPQEAIAAATKAHQFLTTAASTFAQQVALRIYARPELLRAHLPHYREQRDWMLSALGAGHIAHVPPQGTFYVMVRLPARLSGDSLAAALALLETQRVVTVPGLAFGQSCEGYLRLSWAAPTWELTEGVKRLTRFFRGA